MNRLDPHGQHARAEESLIEHEEPERDADDEDGDTVEPGNVKHVVWSQPPPFDDATFNDTSSLCSGQTCATNTNLTGPLEQCDSLAQG
jgi:hypothetical protein